MSATIWLLAPSRSFHILYHCHWDHLAANIYASSKSDIIWALMKTSRSVGPSLVTYPDFNNPSLRRRADEDSWLKLLYQEGALA